MTWPLSRLGNHVELDLRSEKVDPSRFYPMVGVLSYGRGLFDREPVLGGNTSYRTFYRLKSDHIVMSQLFGWEGAVALSDKRFEGKYLSPQFPTFSCNSPELDRGFLGWFLRLQSSWNALAKQTKGMGDRRRTLIPDNLLNLQIPLPAIDEQRRIVTRVEAVAGRVAEARQLREESTAYLSALWTREYRTAFDGGGKLLFIEQVCDELIDYRGRTPPITDRGIPHLTSANVRKGLIDWRTSKFVTEDTYAQYMTRGIPEPGDVLLTMEAPLGNAAVIPDKRKFSLAQRTLLLRPRRSIIEPSYLALALMSPSIHESLLSKATGTTVKGIASKRLRLIGIPVPSLAGARSRPDLRALPGR
jgi:type I restriction enzyme S subunit